MMGFMHGVYMRSILTIKETTSKHILLVPLSFPSLECNRLTITLIGGKNDSTVSCFGNALTWYLLVSFWELGLVTVHKMKSCKGYFKQPRSNNHQIQKARVWWRVEKNIQYVKVRRSSWWQAIIPYDRTSAYYGIFCWHDLGFSCSSMQKFRTSVCFDKSETELVCFI